MQIPNLLNMAMTLVGSQQFIYRKFKSRSAVTTGINIGEYVSAYEEDIITSGQVQAIPHELFEKYGLQFQSNYLMFYVSQEIIDITRDVSGDQMEFNGEIYNCQSQTNWQPINGWTGVIAIKVV